MAFPLSRTDVSQIGKGLPKVFLNYLRDLHSIQFPFVFNTRSQVIFRSLSTTANINQAYILKQTILPNDNERLGHRRYQTPREVHPLPDSHHWESKCRQNNIAEEGVQHRRRSVHLRRKQQKSGRTFLFFIIFRSRSC